MVNRRALLGRLADWGRALGVTALVPAVAPPVEASPPASLGIEAVETGVHWMIGPRHIEAILRIDRRRGATICYEERPASEGGTRSWQSVSLGEQWQAYKDEPGEGNTRPRHLSFHPAAGCPCGRPYSEWWWGRQRRVPVTPTPKDGPLGNWSLYLEGNPPRIEPAIVAEGVDSESRRRSYREETIAALEADLRWERNKDYESVRHTAIEHLESQITKLRAGEADTS